MSPLPEEIRKMMQKKIVNREVDDTEANRLLSGISHAQRPVRSQERNSNQRSLFEAGHADRIRRIRKLICSKVGNLYG